MKLSALFKYFVLLGLLGSTVARAELVTVTEDITGDVTWYATNTYLLNTVVYVASNAVLRIEPGTVIHGGTNEVNLVAREGIPNLVSALWVTRGGQLMAEGTLEEPIIFTMEGDDVNDPDDVPPTVTGQWGGIVIMGRARINTANDDEGDASVPKYDLYEGVTGPGLNFEHAFGGDDDEDSSGVLRYVSIRHTGNEFAEARELNSLSMGAVGRGTVIEHVESYAGSDDGFEFWGGTVNTKWLVSAFIEDDDFDTDQGYSGTNQFWFGIKPPWQGSSDSRGFETDGDLDQNNTGEEPISLWSVYNATLIGRGLGDVGFGGGVGWNPRDEAAPRVYNAIFTEFAEGLRLDNDGLIYFTNGPAGVWNTIWNVGTNGNANAEFLFTDVSFGNTIEDPLLGGVSYTNDLGLDPRPQAGSPALGGALPGAPMEVSYRGAFAGPADGWADGWTALSSLGYLALAEEEPPVSNLIVVTEDITGDVTWYATNTYLLNTVVYVASNAVLRIEPGTVIHGGTNEVNLVAREGIPNLVSALWVTRGGQLMAEGTIEEPIIFTMEGDDVNDPDDIPPTVTGQWGGVVIMGRARINSASDDEGDASTPKYDLYEGVTSPGANFEHAFGGDDDDDSSGVLRYVSIRHTGNEFAEARELNSLSMGAVGRGTVIEYVENFAGSDDGFEWWGGTVNTRYLVSAFIEDDDFDTDQGYAGTNQFWFGIKPPWQGSSDSRGFETDGDLDQNNTGEEPISLWSVYNVTLIGRGQDNVGFGGGVGWNTRDEAAPRVYNAIFTEFAEGLRLDNDGLIYFTNGPAGVWNTIWNVGTNGNANAEFLFTDVSFGNTIEDPLLGGVSYTNDLGLDPRPQAGSPALGGALPGAPMEVSYRGAFSGPADGWADGWTALSSLGYLKPAEEEPTGESFDDWATRNNLPAGQDGLGDDADGDGLANAVEFALGSNPNGENDDRAPMGTTVEVDGQVYPAVTFTRSKTASGVVVEVDAASDLSFEAALELVEESVADLGDGTERVTVRTASAPGAETYFRTQVVAQ